MKRGSVSTHLYLSIAPSAIGTTNIISTGFNLWTIPEGFSFSIVVMNDIEAFEIVHPYGTLVYYDFHLPMG